jgi:ubiquinone/menaquinone biosynthesis C-methylase UbiE
MNAMDCCALEHPYQSGRHDDGAPLRPGGDQLTRRACECAEFGQGQRVLDLGCGVGVGTRQLQARGCVAFGLDRAPHRLAMARRNVPGLLAVAADGRRLPFADGCFDGIVAECVFSLIGYRAAHFAECARVLRAGGRLALTDLYARAGIIPDRCADGTAGGCLSGMTTRDAIFAALADAGLSIETWQDHTPLLKSFVAQLIFNDQGGEALWAGDVPAAAAALRARRPGYFLLLARKPERSSAHE